MTSRMVHQTEATRNKIINMAETLFIDNGFADTQMKDIASATGMSRNTLYRYFQDKYDLGFAILVVVLKRKAAIYNEIMEKIETKRYANALEGIKDLLHAYGDLRFENDDKFIGEFDGYYAGSRVPEEFRTRLAKELPNELSQRLIHVVQLGQDDGSIRTDIPAEHLSVTLLNAVPTFFRRMLLRRDALMEIDNQSIPLLTPLLIQLLLDGMKPPINLKQ